MTDPLIRGSTRGVDQVFGQDRGIAKSRPEQGFCQCRDALEYAIDRPERNGGQGDVGDGGNRIQRGFEDTGLQAEDLVWQDKIRNLTVAVVKNL